MREINQFVMRLKHLLFVVFLVFIHMVASAQTSENLLLQISRQEEDTVKVNLYEKLFDATKNSNHILAMQSVRDMDKLSRKLAYIKGVEKALYLKGTLFFYSNQSDSSLYYYRKYLRSKTVKITPLLRIKTYSNIGIVYQQKQQYDSAVFYFNKSLAQCKKIDCDKTMCVIFNNIGLTVYSMGNAAKSLQYFEQAYQCMLDQNDQENLPNVISNLASLYAENGKQNPDKLFLDLLENGTLSENLKATVYLDLGGFYFRNGKSELAEKYFINSDVLFRKIGQDNPEITHSLGSIYLQKKQYRKALAYFLKVKHRFPYYNQSELLYKDFAKVHFALKAYDSSQFYYEKLIGLKDAKQKKETASALTKAQENVDFIKNESEIKALRLEKKLLEGDTMRNRIMLFSLLFALVAFAAIGFIYLKKERAKRKINELELERKNRKINAFIGKVAQRNKIIDDIETKFEAYKDKQNVQELKLEIIDTLDVGSDGATFNHYFEDQHKGFYATLKNISPDLTNNDLRLCSLCKLRLSLKETASVLNLSIDAVKSGRYRIRKKLNLTTEDSLSDFLNRL